ncbi:MAG: TonB-dependent receptor plug domain-containing protein, partial [Methylocystis sp.]|nr:TonB-dependent receptor plug domain-containing protein [Methylocystis sp.]
MIKIKRSHLLHAASLNALALSIATAAVAQQSLPTIDVGAGRGPARPAPARIAAPGPVRVSTPAPSRAPAVVAHAPGFSPEKKALPIYREPTGQTFTTIKRETFTTTPLVTIGDLVAYSPGVSFKQGNGPRDNTISIRGSAARVNGALRNIVLMEDGFMMTQPDGFSRTDSTDPHAYAGVDVYRGPSSALFGNYANGGAINFRTRDGSEIDGVETGHDFGSFGYINNYVAAGKKIGNLDAAVFVSDVRGQGSTLNTKFDTQTINLKAHYDATPEDRFTFKWVHNQLLGEVPARLSYTQFIWNPCL